MSDKDDLLWELQAEAERVGYARVEIGPEALRLLADAGLPLIIKATGDYLVTESTLPLDQMPNLDEWVTVERVRGLDGGD